MESRNLRFDVSKISKHKSFFLGDFLEYHWVSHLSFYIKNQIAFIALEKHIIKTFSPK